MKINKLKLMANLKLSRITLKTYNEALKIIDEGKLFQEIEKSVSLTHEGHKTTMNALILMESSLIVGDGVHGLLGGVSGGGKSDLAFAVALNFPEKHVHILRNISPKNIYYDFESYDEDFNILILDDIPFNDDLVNLCKELTDNTKKVKELKTVINGKSVVFRLKGKYVVIITYAKTIPDEELANRLFNLGVSIVDKGETEGLVKEKIRDNNIIGGNENLIIERKRFIIQACIHYLLEQKPCVYNPFLSIFNPTNYNNRDVNHFINMTKARTFFEYNEREQIKVNDDLSLTIGSYEDLKFVHDIWAKDEEAQMYKLSERQKQILEILPEMTSDEAFTHVESLNNQLLAQSRSYKKKIKDKEPLANSIAKTLKCSVSTLKHDLDRFEQGTHKSLVEIGFVEKIQLDENNSKSPNFYYKVKNEGNVSNQETNYDNNMQISFAHSLNSSIVKQKIIIDLLIYANIIINERGISYLKKYCKGYDENIDAKDYKTYIAFLEGFFEGAKPDKHFIDLNNTSTDDINIMMNFKQEINESLKKRDDIPEDAETSKICTYSNQEENASIDEQTENKCANENRTCLHIYSLRFQECMEEIGVEVTYAQTIYELLSSGEKTLQEIINKIFETENPDNFNNETTPLKIEVHVNKLYFANYLDFNNNKYELAEEFQKLVKEGEAAC